MYDAQDRQEMQSNWRNTLYDWFKRLNWYDTAIETGSARNKKRKGRRTKRSQYLGCEAYESMRRNGKLSRDKGSVSYLKARNSNLAPRNATLLKVKNGYYVSKYQSNESCFNTGIKYVDKAILDSDKSNSKLGTCTRKRSRGLVKTRKAVIKWRGA